MNNQNNLQNQLNESANRHKKAGKFMLMVAWFMLLGIGFIFFKWHEISKSGAHNTLATRSSTGSIELQIPITHGSRYEVFGKINNQKVLFLIDTGATIVAIPEKIAQKAGLTKGMAIDMLTAGGSSKAYLTKIATLTIGEEIVINNVSATINPDMPEDTVLLGMGALRQLEFTHTQDKLYIKLP
jgi:aspartyl protease family protein